MIPQTKEDERLVLVPQRKPGIFSALVKRIRYTLRPASEPKVIPSSTPNGAGPSAITTKTNSSERLVAVVPQRKQGILSALLKRIRYTLRPPSEPKTRPSSTPAIQNSATPSLPSPSAPEEDIPRPKKPVIYVFSPEDREVTISLSLDPTSRFTAVYPIVPIRKHEALGESLEWRVKTRVGDGSLTEVGTGLEVAYLFWESESRSKSDAGTASMRDINELNDRNAVVLPVEGITLYLDKTLQVLGLHPEARTSFITFWLPHFLEHTYIALRFIPQRDFERRAPLRITPKPDIINRVFMVFKGVSSETVSEWSASRLRGEKDVSWWTDEVGVELEKALDPSLYRVLEWGGMEGV